MRHSTPLFKRLAVFPPQEGDAAPREHVRPRVSGAVRRAAATRQADVVAVGRARVLRLSRDAFLSQVRRRGCRG